ncbi:hypothetical protein DSO57_1037487 [Entomophthora muscae]|uniref:Uncharacterized protein n=1 Tax=Entomophthora muscae TaxID=34485 RepID=A0ACC2SZ48_9FUNG|nr:hypothetical protein DSO57_1037487 [Entomophthora muscae]
MKLCRGQGGLKSEVRVAAMAGGAKISWTSIPSPTPACVATEVPSLPASVSHNTQGCSMSRPMTYLTAWINLMAMSNYRHYLPIRSAANPTLLIPAQAIPSVEPCTGLATGPPNVQLQHTNPSALGCWPSAAMLSLFSTPILPRKAGSGLGS